MQRVGLVYHPAWSYWIDARPSEVGCVEAFAESFTTSGRDSLRVLGEHLPLVLHTHRLSLGTPGGVDPRALAELADLVGRARPLWVSDHLGFCRADGLALPFHLPLPLNQSTLAHFVEGARAVVEACGVPFLLENTEVPLKVAGYYEETDFLNAFCKASGCGLLLDLTALLVNSRNHGFSASAWLEALHLENVRQLRAGACALRDGRWQATHDAALTDTELWELAEHILRKSSVEVVILQRTENFAPVEALRNDLRRLAGLQRSMPEFTPRHGGH